MKRRAHFDLPRFGADVKAGLGGRTYRQFVAEFDHVTIKTLSRAVNSQPLGPANLMAVCAALMRLIQKSCANPPLGARVRDICKAEQIERFIQKAAEAAEI